MAEKKSFVVRHENIEQFEMLTHEQCGELFMAMCYFSRDGKEPEFVDPLLKLAFSFVRGQLVRDAEKYEDICKKRSECGKKGGAPKGNQNAVKKQTKQAKQAKCEPVCEPVTEPVAVCVPVCEPDAAGAAFAAPTHTPHTPHTAEELTIDWVQDFSRSMGFLWSQEEASKFIAYNRDRGRTDGWDYAVRKWEENRCRRQKSKGTSTSMTRQEMDDLNDYLSLSNRFKDEETA